MKKRLHRKAIAGLGAIAAALIAFVSTADAEQVTLLIALKDHHFLPAELNAPAKQPIVIEVSNQDSTPAEFESKTLRVEKIVAANSKITVQIRPLVPGRYRFYDDYHEDTTEGFLTVK
jgi:hypothetical protein